MTAEEIRALYVETLARAEYEQDAVLLEPLNGTPWEAARDGARAEYRGIVAHLVDALEAAGLLPTEADYRWVYEPDGTPLGYRERQLLTAWRDAAVPCSGCGVVERQCGRWRGGTRCCPECRHPTRKVVEEP